MKILLVNSPCRAPTLVPLGLGYIASILRGDGHDVSILDLNALPRSEDEIRRQLADAGPDVVGLAGLSSNYRFVKEFSLVVRAALPEARIVAGNMVSTASPETLLRNSAVEVCVIDEGERTVAELIRRLKDFPDVADVKGIVFKRGADIVRTQARERIADLSSLPFPAWDLFDMPTYLVTDKAGSYGHLSMNVNVVRGCPFECVYCSHPFGRRVVARSTAGVISEIEELKRRYGVEYILFSDDLVMGNPKWLEQLCDDLIGHGLDVGWSASGRVNIVTAPLLGKMRRAGCRAISYGFESGSQRILDAMKKHVTVKQAEDAVRLTRQAGITVFGSLMFGFPGETRESVEETISFVLRADLPLDRLFYTTAYPDTPLYEIGRGLNRLPADEDSYLSSLGEMTDTMLVNFTDMADDDLVALKDWAERAIRANYSRRVKAEIAVLNFRRIAWHVRLLVEREGVGSALAWVGERVKAKVSGPWDRARARAAHAWDRGAMRVALALMRKFPVLGAALAERFPEYKLLFVSTHGRKYRSRMVERQGALIENPTMEEVRVALRSHRPRNVLEVGCGFGRILQALQAEFDVEGCDISQEMLDLCPPGLKVFRYDIASGDEGFIERNLSRWDVVFTRGVMYYLVDSPRHLAAALNAISRVTAKKAIFWEWPEVCDAMKAVLDDPKFEFRRIAHRDE